MSEVLNAAMVGKVAPSSGGGAMLGTPNERALPGNVGGPARNTALRPWEVAAKFPGLASPSPERGLVGSVADGE